MNKRINIMAKWKEFNPLSERSMREDFCDSPSLYHKKIIDYLEKGKIVLVSPSIMIDVLQEKE